MADSLKICIMIHVEDGTSWGTDGPWNSNSEHLSQRLFRLATEVGPKLGAGGAVRGAKLSVQFGDTFLDTAAPAPYHGPSSLRGVLENYGNFWNHGHNPKWNGVLTRHNMVLSAFHKERKTDPWTMGAPFGHSGGTDLLEPTDFVSIGVHLGLLWRNSTAMTNHCLVDVATRPYQLSNEQLQLRYRHAQAPGPMVPDVQTMRIRPFWANKASEWFFQVASSWDAVAVNSMLIIPCPGKDDLAGLSEKSSFDVETLTDDDLKAGLTQVWSTFQLWTANMHTVSGVWYTQIHPEYIDDNSIATIGAWVDSINALLLVNDPAPMARWMNMNEIASTFVHSAYL